jgi:hypothetical protein
VGAPRVLVTQSSQFWLCRLTRSAAMSPSSVLTMPSTLNMRSLPMAAEA